MNGPSAASSRPLRAHPISSAGSCTRGGRAGALAVNQSGHEALPGSRFTPNQDRWEPPASQWAQQQPPEVLSNNLDCPALAEKLGKSSYRRVTLTLQGD